MEWRCCKINSKCWTSSFIFQFKDTNQSNAYYEHYRLKRIHPLMHKIMTENFLVFFSSAIIDIRISIDKFQKNIFSFLNFASKFMDLNMRRSTNPINFDLRFSLWRQKKNLLKIQRNVWDDIIMALCVL